MPNNLGFTYNKRNQEYHILHHGKNATILRGKRAIDFEEQLNALTDNELQQLMARLTGNYKHGNERKAKNHPRNQGY